MKFPPFVFDKEQEEMNDLDWDDFKIPCPANKQFAKKILHHQFDEIKCDSTGFACDPISCPFLYWLSCFYKYGDNIFQLLERKKQ